MLSRSDNERHFRGGKMREIRIDDVLLDQRLHNRPGGADATTASDQFSTRPLKNLHLMASAAQQNRRGASRNRASDNTDVQFFQSSTLHYVLESAIYSGGLAMVISYPEFCSILRLRQL